MICPICGTLCGRQDLFCYSCGAKLYIPETPKKGSHLVPILILILLAVLGTVIFFTVPVTTDPETGDTPWFEVYEGYLYFDEQLYTGGSEITVPAQINGKTVRGISGGCFEDCTDITTVILPETLEEIESSAFAGCTSLRGIHIPEHVYVIGMEAFADCSALEAITIPSEMRFIGPNTFFGCSKLEHVFYDGNFSDWAALYDAFIGPETRIHCLDGSFSQAQAAFMP